MCIFSSRLAYIIENFTLNFKCFGFVCLKIMQLVVLFSFFMKKCRMHKIEKQVQLKLTFNATLCNLLPALF